MDIIETFLLTLKDKIGFPHLDLDECIEKYDDDWYDYYEAEDLMHEMFPTLNDEEFGILRDFFWGVITPAEYGIYRDTWECYERSDDYAYCPYEVEAILNKIMGRKHHSNKVSIF